MISAGQQPDFYPELIITGSSQSYSRQLLAFLGSLRCNWPDHPPVIVYNLGLDRDVLDLLSAAKVLVRDVPPFVPHWRKHFTWKLWCLNDAPGNNVLWLDAGCCVLRPIAEVFDIIRRLGYFSIPNYQPLVSEASEAACEGCGVPAEFRLGKTSLAANVFGFARGTQSALVIEEALQIAHTERFIQATQPEHRHDQAILSLLMYRYNSPFILCDGTIYGFEDLSANFSTHAIWAMRRGMHYKDQRHYAAALFGPVTPRTPRRSHKVSVWYRSAWYLKLMIENLRGLKKEQLTLREGIKR